MRWKEQPAFLCCSRAESCKHLARWVKGCDVLSVIRSMFERGIEVDDVVM